MNSNPNDFTTDSRYDLVIDIAQHPERYDSDQLAQIMSDPETRELYNLLCKIDSSIKVNESASRISADDEWLLFSRRHLTPAKRFLFFRSSRVASIVLAALTSVAAVAVGIVISNSQITERTDCVDPSAEVISETIETPVSQTAETDSTVVETPKPIFFEDNSLEEIINTIAQAYSVSVRFNNEATKRLHLYYKFDPSLGLDKIIDQLNNFEQINIIATDNTLIVD